MLCYRDTTYCTYYTTCSTGDNCSRALTPQVRRDAGSFGLGVMQFTSEPDCYIKKPKDKWGGLKLNE